MRINIIIGLVAGGFIASSSALTLNTTKVSAVGVAAYSVLGQIEMAKNKKINLDEIIEVETQKERLKLVTSKVKSVNDKIRSDIFPDGRALVKERISLRKAYSYANLLSDTFLWANGILTDANAGKYRVQYVNEADLLALEIAESKSIRKDMDSILSLPKNKSETTIVNVVDGKQQGSPLVEANVVDDKQQGSPLVKASVVDDKQGSPLVGENVGKVSEAEPTDASGDLSREVLSGKAVDVTATGTPVESLIESGTNERSSVNSTGGVTVPVALVASSPNIDIVKLLEVERQKSKILLATEKVESFNEMYGAFSLKKAKKEGRVYKDELYSFSNLVKDAIAWGDSVLKTTSQSVYASEYVDYSERLSVALSRANNINDQLVFAMDQLNQQSLEQGLVAGRESALRLSELKELKRIIDGKLLLGTFEHDIYYLTGDYTLNESQGKLVEGIFETIASYADVKIEITGRADPRGGYNYNKGLAMSRADEIMKVAGAVGISEERVVLKSYVSDVAISKNREKHFFDRNSTVKIWREVVEK